MINNFRLLFFLPLISISLAVHPSGNSNGNKLNNEDNIFIFGEWKKTTGTIQNMVQGDRACYIDLVDDLGNEFTELANFDFCSESNLLGKKVHLTYEQAKVLAASCQGDMDCGKSDTVILVQDIIPVK